MSGKMNARVLSQALWIGRAALLVALAGMAMVLAKGPFLVSLTCNFLAVVLGFAAIERAPEDSAAGHGGVSIGLFALLFWLALWQAQ